MNRIAKRFIKYYVLVIVMVIITCFIGSSIFISKFYLNEQYRLLKDKAEYIYSSVESNGFNQMYLDTNAIVIKNNSVTMLGKGKKGMMPFLKNVNQYQLLQNGFIKNEYKEDFLYYKLSTDLGDIVVFKEYKPTADYLKIVYATLLIVFLLSLIFSVPFIIHLSKKFTKPILELQNASKEITAGNFDINLDIKTGDEFENLAWSIEEMAVSIKNKYKMQRNFIINVTHSFRTPLSIAKGYIEAVVDGILDKNKYPVYLQESLNGVNELNQILDSLILLSKLQSGEYELKKEFFDLNDLLSGVLNTYKYKSGETKISIIMKADNIEVYADYNELSRVLSILVDNAIKFSNPESEIQIGAIEKVREIYIYVKDNGIGIECEMLGDIWDKCYKHAKSGGMGLGLAIASEILKLHDYKYGVNSKIGEGSEFYFIAPREV